MDLGQTWDRLLASEAATQTNTLASPGRSTLTRTLKLRAEPDRRWLPRVQRTLNGIAPNLRKAIRECVAGQAPWPLVITGPPGLGKTCAALCLADYVAGSRYWTAEWLCRDLVAAQQGRLAAGEVSNVFESDVWIWIEKTPLVVLDEIGARERVSDHHFEAVKGVIDTRLGQPLVVVSNLNLAAIEQVYDERISDRLSAGTVVELVGVSRRRSG